MDLYVYYRAQRSDAAAIQAAVSMLQQQLRRQLHQRLQQQSQQSLTQHGPRCGLKQRPRVKDERDTWMEIYLAVPDDFEAALAAAVAASPLPQLIDGDRHVEYFLECLPCA